MPRNSGSPSRGSTLGRTATTSFVGRRQELAAARARMVDSRLLTLVGPGGVGKTRLALELAEGSRRAFRDGVWLIELDSLRSGERVAAAVATALNISDQSHRAARDRILDHLREREVLLILDNCEHVLQDVAELADALLAEAPQVRLLATSREPLHLIAEHICVVPPLSTPPLGEAPDTPPLSEVPDTPPPPGDATVIDDYESVVLLVDRARHLVPGFELTPTNRAAVAQLCARLDGIPLAIELAATRLRSLSPQQLLERLDQRFQLLTRGDRAGLPRQQTLQALIDWSYGLCSPAEQLLWRRLAVFPDVFDLAAAEYVGGFGELDPLTIFDLLDQLVAKSILQTERMGEQIHYRMLMTVREYAAQLLADEAEQEQLRRRHRDHYLERALARARDWCGPRQAEALMLTRREKPNLAAALEWSLQQETEVDAAAWFAVALRYHWIAGGFLSEGRGWLERILQHPDLSPAARGTASWVAGWVALIQGEHLAAEQHLAVSLASARTLQDAEMATSARHWQALHRLFTGDLVAAAELFTGVIPEYEAQGRLADQLTAMFQLVMVQAFSDQAAAGLELVATARRIAEGHGERWNRAYLHWLAAVCHRMLGDFGAARRDAHLALEIQQDFRDGICTAMSLELLSWVAVSTAELEQGRQLAYLAESV